MEAGHKRTIMARIAAGLGILCGVMAVLAGSTTESWWFTPHGWGIGGILLLLIAMFLLLDGVISLGKAGRSPTARHVAPH